MNRTVSRLWCMARNAIGLLCLCTLAAQPAVQALDVSGYLAAQGRYFAHAPLDARQRYLGASVAAQAEFYHEFAEARQSVLFTPFVRLDSADPRRTHFDVRELMWQYLGEEFEVRAGIGKVFWGVAESQHLVDIINQSDLIENIDGEDKLGQAMLSASLTREWGTVDLFLLPGFRQRTFPGTQGRLRTTPRVDVGQTLYESGAGNKHLDVAVRWSHSFGAIDLALSHFRGTSRDPNLNLGRTSLGETVLVPFYAQINQTGLELQYTYEEWLWKLEAIRRSGKRNTFFGVTGGFEYTITGVADTPADVGLIAEYLYDSRGERGASGFQKDVLAGLRLTLNDENSTEFLAGVVTDLDDGSHLLSVEASRRVGVDLKLTLEARAFADITSRASIYSLRRDDFVQLELAWFF
jgi:hypothetical protein